MALRLNKRAYHKMILEDLKWLEQFPDTLERRHIEHIILDSTKCYYEPRNERTCGAFDEQCVHDKYLHESCVDCSPPPPPDGA
jgi:hypothetical protein